MKFRSTRRESAGRFSYGLKSKEHGNTAPPGDNKLETRAKRPRFNCSAQTMREVVPRRPRDTQTKYANSCVSLS